MERRLWRKFKKVAALAPLPANLTKLLAINGIVLRSLRQMTKKIAVNFEKPAVVTKIEILAVDYVSLQKKLWSYSPHIVEKYKTKRIPFGTYRQSQHIIISTEK